MSKKLFTIADLGGGDGGKGGTVHKVSQRMDAHTILKVGGAQGNHGVRTARGQSFNFSQFGCGTFEGIRTHLSELMVIEPYRLLHEGDQLQNIWGLSNIFDKITIDSEALCITPFHTIASQLRELDRKDKPKGTVGIGAGEAVLDAENFPELSIRAKDLNSPQLQEKLALVRTKKIADLQEIIERVPTFWTHDQTTAQTLLELLEDQDFISRIIERFNTLGSLVKVVGQDYLGQEILNRDGVIVVESSHGVLTDRYHGFHPHTTKLRTVPETTWNWLKDKGYDGEVIKLAVTRAYQIRHGAGPMVTESPDWLEKMLPHSSKDENRWQGKVRVGPLDFVALRYALEVCGGPQAFDGLALTWFDQIKAIGEWPTCSSYQGATDPNFFTSLGEIKVSHLSGAAQLEHQGRLTEKLRLCTPNLNFHDILGKNQAQLINLSEAIIQAELKVPLRLISFGPTEADKICL